MQNRFSFLVAALFLSACGADPLSTGLSSLEAGANVDAAMSGQSDAAALADLRIVDATALPDFATISPDLTLVYDLQTNVDFAGVSFPARHPPMPQVVNSGGRRLVAARLISVTFAGNAHAPALDEFLLELPNTSWWRQVMSTYGIGAGTTLPPVHLTETPLKKLDDSDVKLWLADKLDGSHLEFGTPDGSSLYVIYYPYTTHITIGGQQSCVNFSAYHGSVQLQGGPNVSYAVVAQCVFGNGQSAFDDLTGPASHEVAEAATDADPGGMPAYRILPSGDQGWAHATNSEVGDMCFFIPHSFYKATSFNFVVQRSWSNTAAAASHDPCVPAPPDIFYFNSAPVLTDTIHIDKQATLGILAAVGHSATIELDLYSDGPTLPWTVSASTDPTILGSSAQQLQFAFDQTTGVNGSKIRLTVTVVKAGPGGYELFAIESTLGWETNQWMVAVADH